MALGLSVAVGDVLAGAPGARKRKIKDVKICTKYEWSYLLSRKHSVSNRLERFVRSNLTVPAALDFGLSPDTVFLNSMR